MQPSVRFQQRVVSNEVAQNPQLANPPGLESEERSTVPVYWQPGGSMTTIGTHMDAGKSQLRERVLALGRAFQDIAAILSESGSDPADGFIRPDGPRCG